VVLTCLCLGFRIKIPVANFVERGVQTFILFELH